MQYSLLNYASRSRPSCRGSGAVLARVGACRALALPGERQQLPPAPVPPGEGDAGGTSSRNGVRDLLAGGRRWASCKEPSQRPASSSCPPTGHPALGGTPAGSGHPALLPPSARGKQAGI